MKSNNRLSGYTSVDNTGVYTIFYILTCAPFNPAHGSAPNVNISYAVTPHAQTSEACENFLYFKHSGAHLFEI